MQKINKTVLITGASSDIAQPLIELILNNTNFNLITTSYKNSVFQNSRIQNIKVDFSKAGNLNKLFQEIQDKHIAYYIQLHGFINQSNLQDFCINDFNNNLEINLIATTKIISQILKNMIDYNFGRICLISTASAQHGGGEHSFAYGLSKNGLNYLVKHLAKYYSKYNIISNAVAPGFIQTKFHKNLKNKDLKQRAKSIKVGYAGTSQDVSDIIFQLMFKNNFINGEIITTDGGDFL